MGLVQRVGSLVVVVCPPKFDDAFIDALAKNFDPIFAARQRFVCITQTSGFTQLPDAKCRRHLADWMNRAEMRKAQAETNVGSSTIIGSPALRTLLTALFWMWTPPTPQHVAGNTDEALEWCLKQLEADRTPLGEDPAVVRAAVRSLCGA